MLFIAVLSPAVVLARTWRRAAVNRGWQVAAVAVLLVTALASLFALKIAGYIGGGAWLFFLFLPAVGLRKAAQLAADERFGSARRIVSALRFFHPVRSVREETILLHALELAQTGEKEHALELFRKLTPNDTRAGREASAQVFRIRGDWEGLLAWSQQNIPRLGLGQDPAQLSLYFRSLGETGAIDELARQFGGRSSALLASPPQEGVYLSCLMLLLAFSGRTDSLRELFETALRGLRAETQEFWLATSESLGGDRARLVALRARTTDAFLRADIDRRLARINLPGVSVLSPSSAEIVERFARHPPKMRGGLFAPSSRRVTSAVAIFIALNVAMYFVEVFLGGATNDLTLYKLGALEPVSVIAGHQYWRLLACLFLHYGAIHLLFNAYALYILGPTLEEAVGFVRFVICYLVSGLGSSLGVLLLWRIGWTKSDFLVGASGCVMGIVGAWAGVLLRERHIPSSRRRLTSIAVIVAMQTAFDFYTPQVSMAAHLSGLVTGLLVGLVIAPAE
ncbi:MAG: rhomboid family intramembrane serine protease [Chthoniobacterales bacterium]